MDHTLVDLALLSRLFEQFRPRLLRMLELRIDPSLRSRVDPEDILQDVFITAAKNWHKKVDELQVSCSAGTGVVCHQDSAKPTPYVWLYGLARDRLLIAWRRHCRQCRHLNREMQIPDGTSMVLGLRLFAKGTSPSKRMSREELQADVRRLMDDLKPDSREILWMRNLDQLSYEEIACRLNISSNCAAARHARALKQFRKVLASRQEIGA